MKQRFKVTILALLMAIICAGCQKKDDISEKAPDAASTTESAFDVSVSDESAVGDSVAEDDNIEIKSEISEDRRYHSATVNGVDYSLTVDLTKWEGNTNLLQIETLESLFWQVYPKMYERFGTYSSAPTDVELLIENEGYEIACAWENKVHLHDMWLHDNPEDFDCYTHELAHLIQNGWSEDYLEYDSYIERFADYCRYIYAYDDGKYNDKGWTLQTVETENTRELSVRFLVWLDYELSSSDRDFMYDYFVLCSDCQFAKTDWPKAWKTLFAGTKFEGKTIDEVWNEYSTSDFAILSSNSEKPGESDLLSKYDIRNKCKK